MLRKEFRILLPFSCEEYRRGQLYCVAKSSSLETKGDSGVEVLANEPYHDDETGQDGQYTFKVYHLGSRLPGWIAALAPAGALKLEERAWNAFPYCKTELSLPVLGDRFTFRIESKYFDDDLGDQDNAFGLSAVELPGREVDKQDFTDSSLISPEDYKEESDPTKFHSEKTGRGPLVKGEWQATAKPLMCAYKLVSVEFRWWGLQTRIQSFIMGTMTGMLAKFHRQMFCWLDEWIELTMEQVREYENQVQEEMRQKLDTSNEPPTPDVLTPPPTPIDGALESTSMPKLTSSSTPKLATASTSTPKLEDPAPQKAGWGWW